ncbi:MAG: aldose 1-epimerase family protein [Treponema sp.]|jgi:galactose mutarotase-like enzyme|nr:aldose 1-epimerase family protein [Treponema sp.]
MNQEAYYGHQSQLYGVEEHRLIGGKGDGMRLLEAKNGRGVEFTVAADRCADISRISYRGVNLGYFAPCGYVAPQYYDTEPAGMGFLKSFTAGFITTCGLTSAGFPCEDDGEKVPLHGDISHTPAEHIYSVIEDGKIKIRALILNAWMFHQKLELNREIALSLSENYLEITDRVKNRGTETYPLMLLYHINFGYPMLTERAVMRIFSKEKHPFNEIAAKNLDEWDKLTPPSDDFIEQCYYHFFEKEGKASLYNPDLKIGVTLSFDINELPYMVQWKLLKTRDYVIGFEPGNCHALGRDKMRQEGKLQYIVPGEERAFHVRIRIEDK